MLNSEALVLLPTLRDAGILEVGNQTSSSTELFPSPDLHWAFPEPLLSSDKWNLKITQKMIVRIKSDRQYESVWHKVGAT